MVLIIDTETTGLSGVPKDRVLEIGIAELTDDGEIRPVYNEMIRYDDMEKFDREYVSGDGSRGVWIYRNSSMKLEDTLNAEKDLDTVVKEVLEIVDGKNVTAYNVPFDYDKFLYRHPWGLKGRVTVPYDIMDMATKEVYRRLDEGLIEDKGLARYLTDKRAHSYYENSWVRSNDAYHVLCPDDPMDLGQQTHRALDDAIMEAWILKALL